MQAGSCWNAGGDQAFMSRSSGTAILLPEQYAWLAKKGGKAKQRHRSSGPLFLVPTPNFLGLRPFYVMAVGLVGNMSYDTWGTLPLSGHGRR